MAFRGVAGAVVLLAVTGVVQGSPVTVIKRSEIATLKAGSLAKLVN
jgi:hypothetical protein